MRIRLQGPAIVGGGLLYLWGVSAFAQAGPNVGIPDYQAWFQIVLGLLIAVIGAYAKGVSDRVTDNRREIESLRSTLNMTQLSIATNHHTKDEANSQFHELRAGINSIHRRLDALRAPSSFQVTLDDS